MKLFPFVFPDRWLWTLTFHALFDLHYLFRNRIDLRMEWTLFNFLFFSPLVCFLKTPLASATSTTAIRIAIQLTLNIIDHLRYFIDLRFESTLLDFLLLLLLEHLLPISFFPLYRSQSFLVLQHSWIRWWIRSHRMVAHPPWWPIHWLLTIFPRLTSFFSSSDFVHSLQYIRYIYLLVESLMNIANWLPFFRPRLLFVFWWLKLFFALFLFFSNVLFNAFINHLNIFFP